MHIECASLKPNVENQGHRSHLHTVLDNNISKSFHCEACGSVIKSPLCACCAVCNIRFHLQCGLAFLPPSINLPEHDHHLFLTVSNLDRDDDSFLQLYCHVCQKETIKQKCPFYSCAEPECDYNAHTCCVIPEVQVDEIIEKRIHFSDKHYLTLLKNDRIINGYVFLKSMRKCYPRCRPSIWLRSLWSLSSQILYGIANRDSTSFHSNPFILEKHSSSKDYREWRACGKYCYGFTYCDKEYNLHLDVTCAFLQPSINCILSQNV